MLFTTDEAKRRILESTDQYADSFARDVTIEELRRVSLNALPRSWSYLILLKILDHMPSKYDFEFDPADFKQELDDHHHSLGGLRGWMFSGLVIYADCGVSAKENNLDGGTESETQGSDIRVSLACDLAKFAGARIVHSIHDENITHIIVGEDPSKVKKIRQAIQRLVSSLYQKRRGCRWTNSQWW